MDILIPTAVGAGLAAFSARWNWWRAKTGGLAVLVYHKIGVPPENSKLRNLWVTADNFRKHLLYLKNHGFETILFSDLAKAVQGHASLPKKPALITFDDGYKNNYTAAFPVMKETGSKGNIFVVYDTIGKHNVWHKPDTEPWIDMMTWDMIKEMAESKSVEFGSHTMTHPNLAKTPLDEVSWECRESKKRLEEALGGEITAFAYPYGAGAYMPEVREKAREAGYVLDFSFRQGKSPWLWKPEKGPIKRLFIRGSDNMLDLYLHLSRGRARL